MSEDVVKIPDTAEPMLGFRVWRFREDDLTLWSVTKGNPKDVDKKRELLSGTTPNGYWPKKMGPMGTSVLEAKCLANNDHHVPDKNCTCGIYATYDSAVIAQYILQGPVLGLVQGYGTVVPGEANDETLGGFRAEKAKLVALFEISPDFTIPRRQLHRVGQEYGVPVIVPWSVHAGDYAAAVRENTLVSLANAARAQWSPGELD